jgi:hypothetical protein
MSPLLWASAIPTRLAVRHLLAMVDSPRTAAGRAGSNGNRWSKSLDSIFLEPTNHEFDSIKARRTIMACCHTGFTLGHNLVMATIRETQLLKYVNRP